MVTRTKKTTPVKPKPTFTWEPVNKKKLRFKATECVKVSSPSHSSQGDYWFITVDDDGLSFYTSPSADCTGPCSADNYVWLNDIGGMSPETVLDHLDALEALIKAFRNSVNMAGQS